MPIVHRWPHIPLLSQNSASVKLKFDIRPLIQIVTLTFDVERQVLRATLMMVDICVKFKKKSINGKVMNVAGHFAQPHICWEKQMYRPTVQMLYAAFFGGHNKNTLNHNNMPKQLVHTKKYMCIFFFHELRHWTNVY